VVVVTVALVPLEMPQQPTPEAVVVDLEMRQ
jgi:hypothetical protein